MNNLRALWLAACLAALASLSQGARAEDPSPAPKLTLKQRQDMRFPQPVRVGALHGEPVIQAGSQLRRLGVVMGVFRVSDGDDELVFRYGGLFGFGGRVIAPSLDEVSLVGAMVKINDLDKMDLAALPTFTGAGGAFLAPDTTIRIGVDRKY